MNRTDVLTGRIVQRVLDARASSSSKVTIFHGVEISHKTDELIDNLFVFFPNSSITFKKLKYGYELKIEVDFKV